MGSTWSRSVRSRTSWPSNDGWTRLYDADQLSKNTVPASAAIYCNDMYVDREMWMQTTSVVRGLRPWVTTQYEHDGLRQGGVLDRLLKMARGGWVV